MAEDVVAIVGRRYNYRRQRYRCAARRICELRPESRETADTVVISAGSALSLSPIGLRYLAPWVLRAVTGVGL